MVPKSSRQLLVWSLPALAVLLSLLWYRRKQGASLRSDPGGTTRDTGSTSGDTVQQAGDLQVSVTASIPAEKQLTGKEELCEGITIAPGGIEVQIDKPKGLVVKEERKSGTPHQPSSELVLEERVLSETAHSVFTGVPGGVGNCEDSDIIEIDAKKEIQEMSAAECPVDNLVCMQKFPVKSIVKGETKIAVLEGSVCNGLESPEHLTTDKISDINSSATQVERKEVHETTNKKLSASVATTISSLESSESCQLGPEVHVLATSDPLERTAEEQNRIGELEASPLNIKCSEEISGKLQISVNRILQDNKDTDVGFQDSEGEVQVLPLNVDILGNLKFVKSVEKDIDSGDTKISAVEDMEGPEDNESISSVDSFSVATIVLARKSSTETLTMEKLAHEEEGAKESVAEMSAQGSGSVPLECTLSSLELNGGVIGEASSDAGSMSRNGATAGTFALVSKQQRTERDSANHSPADVMLASPSISSCSDAQSEVMCSTHACRLYLHSPYVMMSLPF